MKVLHTIGGFGVNGGGTSTCTYDLLSTIHELNIKGHIDILTPSVFSNDDKIMGKGEEWIKVVPNDYKTPLSFSNNLTDFIKKSDYDIYHANGLWMHVNHQTCKIARKKEKPYIITPHGMLYPEALARSAWKKWPLKKLWFDKDIKKASCIHVTCEKEMQHVRDYGYKGPIAVIGNSVNIPHYIKELFLNRSYKKNNVIRIGFLGRLHPIKKIENIIKGLAISNRKDVELYIIGKGNDNYEKYLRDEVERLNLNTVKFLGFIIGEEKFRQLANLDALFVPSDMENFGMIIPEALIVGTPVMASHGTPWKSLNENKCGWWTDNSPESIANVIEEVSNLNPEEHKAMGERGRKLVIEKFAANKVASEMLNLYQWILGQASKPDFVYD